MKTNENNLDINRFVTVDNSIKQKWKEQARLKKSLDDIADLKQPDIILNPHKYFEGFK